ncbi:FAD:protein FMN transferase [Paenibacillus paridis]|uniref:FAD:protein FMN transferase n=1 Tax=Paenibacillus paridis TaxID=2583376 RepID=UPI00111FED82|nr:FAD:protein FMN transferase [Paenibacillus paridis]
MDNRTTIHFRAMNTDVEAILIHNSDARSPGNAEDNSEAGEYAALVKQWFLDMENRLSRFRADSELSQLNRSGGNWQLVSPLLFQILSEANKYRMLTGGLFNVHMLKALEAAGYSQSFEHIGHIQGFPIHSIGPATSDTLLEMDAGMKAVRLQRGAEVDLGGIAKSWSARKLADWLRRKRGVQAGMINAGGDAAIWDLRSASAPAELRIQNPWKPDCAEAVILLRNGGIATSSTLGRSWNLQDGTFCHHILDPRTMKPSRSDVVQCTITGPDVTACEVWAKAVCIAGFEEGTALLATYAPEYAGYMYTADRTLRKHEASSDRKGKEGIGDD